MPRPAKPVDPDAFLGDVLQTLKAVHRRFKKLLRFDNPCEACGRKTGGLSRDELDNMIKLTNVLRGIEKDRTHVWLQELRRMSAFELETAAARAEAEAADGEVMAGG